MSVSERRRFPRFPFHSQGALSLAGQHYPGTVLDVSLKGALFSADAAFAADSGHSCKLELFHAGQPALCHVDAVVAYRREGLVGLEFVEPGENARQLLQTIMEMNLAVHSLLNRNLPEMLGQTADTSTQA